MNLWTKAHALTYLPMLAIMICIAIILRVILLKKDEKIRMIPIKIVAIALVALEIGKQVLSFNRGYNLYHIPLHYCSIFVFVVPLVAFLPKRVSGYARALFSSMGTALFMLMLIYPNTVYDESRLFNYTNDFLHFHAVTFHIIVIFALILVVALDLYEPKIKSDFKTFLFLLSCYCLVAGTMAQILESNYHNFYYCTVDFIETVRLDMLEFMGYGVGQTIYVICVSCVTLIFSSLSYLLYVAVYGVINKRSDKALKIA